MSGPEGPIIVIGAGAAGLMAAIFATTSGRPVILLEKTKDGGRKIIISGGGRCNVLPSRLSPRQYITASSPNTLRNMLLSWPLPSQQKFFEHDLGVPLALEQASGKLFPASNRARDVRDALVNEARRRGVDIRFDTSARDIVAAGVNRWTVALADGPDISAESVIVATGGLSVPATGSDGTGLRILERLGHTVNDTYPALTPLTADPPRHASLAGVSLDVRLTAPLMKGRFDAEGGFLFTHRGYSGPAVLNISHVAVRSRTEGHRLQPVLVQWTDKDADEWDAMLREGGSGQIGPLLRKHLPARLADLLIEEATVDPQRTLAELRREERARLVAALARYPLPWTGDEGYRKAEVTGGGIALGEFDPRTLESRVHHGLFVCGEALDAFGPIGGYNFAWAWATGRAAGLGAARGAQATSPDD
ncbi:MAG TPA: aminoacetone oxidase family FAD-binding enzyme [Longimicrobiales bacterium]|nr:aminoacetone oxidase family FAD-binding enzyme [Longimicrobiales bacterium]